MAHFRTAADLRICVDRILPSDMKHSAAQRAIEVNPKNDPTDLFRKLALTGVSASTAKMALLTGKIWPKGKQLSIAFLDGSTTQQQRVRKHAEEWLSYANVRFDWKGGANAELRISFAADPGSWSAIGTDCLSKYFPKDQATMNFGWLTDETDDTEYNRVVVHEFGHALGAIHEHQNPKSGIEWNVPAVIAAFSGPPNNWSPQDIQDNVIGKYAQNQLNATTFDPASIMLYAFAKELIKGPPALAKHGTRSNTDLSAKDKKFIRKNYPK
jgi:hypothetical protein